MLARGELDETPTTNRPGQADDDARALQEQLEALGIVADGPLQLGDAQVFYLWPENLDAWRFFRGVETQWRHGFAGPTGLDYAGVQTLMDRARVHPRHQRRMWQKVWAMERGALTGWAELRAERARD